MSLQQKSFIFYLFFLITLFSYSQKLKAVNFPIQNTVSSTTELRSDLIEGKVVLHSDHLILPEVVKTMEDAMWRLIAEDPLFSQIGSPRFFFIYDMESIGDLTKENLSTLNFIKPWYKDTKLFGSQKTKVASASVEIIDSLGQLVGHTSFPHPQYYLQPYSLPRREVATLASIVSKIDIDCVFWPIGSRFYCLIKGKEVCIFDTDDLKLFTLQEYVNRPATEEKQIVLSDSVLSLKQPIPASLVPIEDTEKLHAEIYRMISRDRVLSKIPSLELFTSYEMLYNYEFFKREDFLNYSFLQHLVPVYEEIKGKSGKTKKLLGSSTTIFDADSIIRGTVEIYHSKLYFRVEGLNYPRKIARAENEFKFLLSGSHQYFYIRDGLIYVDSRGDDNILLEEFVYRFWEDFVWYEPANHNKYTRIRQLLEMERDKKNK